MAASQAESAAHPDIHLGNSVDCGQCPVCKSSDVRMLFWGGDRLYRTTDKTFLIVECGACRLMRLFPVPSPVELRTYYPDNYWYTPGDDAASRLEQVYRRFVLRDHLRFVRRALEKSGSSGIVLDVGCGGGLFLRLLSESSRLVEQQKLRVIGLDFSLDAASVAISNSRIPALCGRLTEAPLAQESCAAITMFHVLEHLLDPAAYLRAAHRLLRPDGRLIVQVPNAACWQFLLLGDHWSGIDVPRHLIDFRPRDLERLLGDCGFEALRVKHFSLRDNPAGLATSIAPGLDPMARRVRRIPETPRAKLLKDLAYFGLVVASLPFTLLEAACRAGSTIMVEARKK